MSNYIQGSSKINWIF